MQKYLIYLNIYRKFLKNKMAHNSFLNKGTKYYSAYAKSKETQKKIKGKRKHSAENIEKTKLYTIYNRR